MKKNYSKSLLSGLCFILCIGVLIGFGRVIKDSEKPSSSSTHEIISRGIEARMLSSTTNSYGEKDQVFSYSITPSNASNQEVEISMTYSDETDCSEVMEYSLDTTNKQVTLSCKAPFSKQINVVLKAKANENATTTIVLDYVKKLKSITPKDETIFLGIGSSNTVSHLDPLLYCQPTYSIYTMDKNYSFDITVSSFEIKDDFVANGTTPDEVYTTFENTLKSKIENQSNYFTADELWNLSNSNDWHTILKNTAIEDSSNDQNCFYCEMTATIKCIEDSTIIITSNIAFCCSLYGDYSSKTI